jgi:hypothetical protein
MAQEVLALEFADGEYEFRITLQGINEIQKKCDAGIGAVWARLASARLDYIGEQVGVPNNAITGETAKFRIEDIIEPIRQGLIGGRKGRVDGQDVDVSHAMANRLIENYVLQEPLQKSWYIAYAVVGALIEGYDPPKKKVSDPEMTATDDSTTQEPSPTA